MRSVTTHGSTLFYGPYTLETCYISSMIMFKFKKTQYNFLFCMPKSALKCFILFLESHNALFKENRNIQTENILLLNINGCEAVGLNWPLCE